MQELGPEKVVEKTEWELYGAAFQGALEGSDQYKFGLTLHRSSIEAKWALLFPSDSV